MRYITLTVSKCDNTGDIGLSINGLGKNYTDEIFVASSGTLLAHDIVEHQNGINAIGSIDDELEALGAVWFTRGQFDDMSRDGIGSSKNAYQNIAADIEEMFIKFTNKNESVNACPVTHNHNHDETFDIIINYFKEDVSNIADNVSMLATFTAIIKARLRIGYNKASRRFKTAIHANNLFWSIADAANEVIKHELIEGQQFRLAYGNGQATITEVFDNYY